MNRRGFTLIEILIAILILGIVLSTVYASYTGTFRIISETGNDAEIYSMARSTLDRMARDLQSVALWRGAFTFTSKSYNLGEQKFVRLTFRSAAHIPLSEKEAPDGIAVVEYGVEESADKEGYALWRSDSLYRDPLKEESSPGGYLLCNQVEALTYTFYDEKGKEYDEWNSGSDIEMQKKKTPAAILIRLRLANKSDPKHPYLFSTRLRLPFNHPEAL